jgi:lipopolysaccharide export LptBFGC system permease protein LptF
MWFEGVCRCGADDNVWTVVFVVVFVVVVVVVAVVTNILFPYSCYILEQEL